MRPSTAVLVVALLLAVTPFSRGEAELQPLRVGGTGGSVELLRRLGKEFTAATGVKVEVVPNLGSSGGIRALGDNLLDIAVSARPAKAAETVLELRQVAALRTAFVFATSHPSPGGLAEKDLPAIFAAQRPLWPDGTSIRIILRTRSDTDSTMLAEQFSGLGRALELARARPDVPVAATDQDNADLAERVAGSLTATTAVQIITEARRLHVVPLDGVAPTFANFERGIYRHARTLRFYAHAKLSPDVARFAAFLQSPPALKVLRDSEVLPETE
jgi:phosphate transport system substrate-binding protein